MSEWQGNASERRHVAESLPKTRSSARALLVVALLVLTSLAVGASATTVLPGLRAPLLDTPATPSTFRNGITGTASSGLDANDVDIQELARGLKYDPWLIYKFVHDHIRFTPMWGEVKGPYMTWMDRSGSSFDQAGLMLALLTEAAEHGTEYTITNPMFVVGEIELSASQFTSWFGLPSGVSDLVAEKVLARSGLYATVDSSPLAVNLEHVWVRVTIDSTTYNLDPSFKTHTVEEPLWNLATAMGYQSSEFLTGASSGAAIDTYVENVNSSNIADDLKDYSASLSEYLKNNQSGADLKDIVGGVRIEPVDESTLPLASLPYTVASNNNDYFPLNQIPDMYRRTLRIQHAGLDETFFSSDIYGRRLTLQYNVSNQPQLVLDGTVQATGSVTNSGQAYDLTFSVDHPYDAGNFDQSTTTKVVSGGFYHIVNGWGDTGTQILRKQRDLLEEYRYDGYSDTSEHVLGESYALIGTTWLAQVSRVRAIAAPMVSSTLVNHHFIGVAGHNDPNMIPYIDMPLGCMAVTSDTADTDDRQGVFLAVAGHASAYESQVIRQLQDCNAVSTVSLMDKANADDTDGKIYEVTDYNWNTVRTAVSASYDSGVLDDVDEYIDGGFTVYLPEKGDLTEDDWTGAGYQALLFDANGLTASYIIGGGYSGGAAAGDTAMSPATLFDNCYGAEYGRSGDGAYGFGSTDIAIGSGGYPFGLSFSRQYSTRRRFEDGPLGLGWTHSLDIQALIKSDAFQFLGVDSPIDAAPQIVSIFVTADIPSEWSHVILNDITASLCQSWLMDQMIDKVVVIKQGSGTTTFTVDPNDPNGTTYNPPPGQKLKLVEVGGNFRMKNSSGIFLDFDSSNRIAQWSDPFGNKVDFTYTSEKLTGVTSKINDVTCRSLTFTYDGDHISDVTDSAGRSVSYDYDAYGQLDEFTNLDGNDVTYAYDEAEDGLMTEIYSPIDANNPVLEIVYDDLGRMKQQIDANDCTWDYYLATYRSEVVEPNQIDPNDSQRKRFSTVRWANPESREVITTDQIGRQTTSEYDGQLRTTGVLNATGVSSDMSYDENSNVTQVTASAIAGSGEENLVVSTTYFDHEDPTTGRWFVDVNETTNVAGEVTSYEYDYDTNHGSDPNYGRLLKVTYPDVNTPSGTQTPVAEFVYASDGRIARQDDPNGMITEYEYYSLTTDPNQGAGLKEVVVDVNGLELTTEYTYDTVGRQATVTDPRGNTTEYEYFDSGLLRRTISPSPFNYETIYEYYDDGKLKHVKTYSRPGANELSSDPNCVALWRFENGALTADSKGTNTLINSGVSSETIAFQEGSGCGDYEKNESDKMYIYDSSLDSGFPLKNGDTNRKFSLCLWTKFESLPGEGQQQDIFRKESTDKKSIIVKIQNVAGNTRVYLGIGYNGGASWTPLMFHATPLAADRWYHIGVTYDDSTRGCRIRIWDDTAQQILGTDKTGTFGYNINVEDGTVILGYGADSLQDEMVIFNDVLTPTEIDEIREGTYTYSFAGRNDFTGDPNCMALWRFEDGTLTGDSKGTNTLINSGVSSETSAFQEGSGCGDYEKNESDKMYIYDSSLDSGFPLKNGDTNRKFSLCLWTKFESLPGEGQQQDIFRKESTDKKSIILKIYNVAGNTRLYLGIGYNGGVSWTPLLFHASPLSAGRWYHIGVTYDDSTRGCRIRIWDDTAQTILGTDKTGTFGYNINVEDGTLTLGYGADSLQDEMVVFNDILTPSEIDEIRAGTYGDGGSSGSSSELVYLQSITYNSRGQKETVRGPYPENATAAELAVNYTQYRYDALGRLWQVEDAEGNVTETRYYPDGRVWKVIDAKGNDAVTKTYNEDGSLQKVADAEGNETQYEYNGFMKLDKTIFEDGSYEELDYDIYQRLVEKTTRDDQTIAFTYDALGRVASKVITDPNNPIDTSNTVTYAYDILGRMVEMSDDTGTIGYAYDAVGRLTDVTYPGSKTVSYQYDAGSNRTRLTYPDSSYITYSYDALSRLTEVRNQASTVLAEYTYDDLSRRTELAYANGTNVAYTYDTASRLLDVNNVTDTGQLKYAYTYDDVGNRLTMAVTDSVGTSMHAYTYDDIYQVNGVDYPADFDHLAIDTTFNYDDVGNRTSVVDANGTVPYTVNELNQYTAVSDVNHVYDDNGNMINDGQLEYTYDAENRLILVRNVDPLAAACDVDLVFTTYGDATWFAQSDEYYNDNDAAQSGAIDASEETWLQTTVIGPGNVSFYYKLASASEDELTFYIDDTPQITWTSGTTWNYSGQWAINDSSEHVLKWKYSKTSGGSSAGTAWVDNVSWSGSAPASERPWSEIEYTYDPSGRRIAKDVDGTVTKYIYDGDQCIAEYDGSDTLLRKYVHGCCIDEPICMIEATGSYADTYYYHYDALGSVVALSDADGDTVEVYEYDVYGQVAASDPNHPNPFLFTGRRYDTETGLYYYRARYYNPAIGRFLQTDPIGYGDGMNMYAYCGNNPTGIVDPSGMVRTFDGYSVVRAEGGGIETTLYWNETEGPNPGPYEHTFTCSSWEEWVLFMASDYAYSTLLIDPEDSDSGVGWGLMSIDSASDSTSRKAFWSLRALVHLGITSDETIIALQEEHTKIISKSTLWLHEHRYGRDNRIWWSFYAVTTPDLQEKYPDQYGEWALVVSPLAALAHELEHARLTQIDSPNVRPGFMRRVQEAHAIAVQNATMSAIYDWNPDYYEYRWGDFDWIRDNSDSDLTH